MTLNRSVTPSNGPLFCSHCDEGFEEKEKIVNTNGEILHQQCFVCAQCFKSFDKTEVYYEFGGRKYCEHDFQVLFAPCCGKCRQFVIGRVIKALNNSWHPNCFNCQLCERPLADQGFIKNNGRALCHDCNVLEKAAAVGRYVCNKCKDFIDEQPLKIKVSVTLASQLIWLDPLESPHVSLASNNINPKHDLQKGRAFSRLSLQLSQLRR